MVRSLQIVLASRIPLAQELSHRPLKALPQRWQKFSRTSKLTDRTNMNAVILLVLCSVSNAAIWHPYDMRKKLPDKCPIESSNYFDREFRSKGNIDSKFISKYKLWPNLVSKYDTMHGETMAFS